MDEKFMKMNISDINTELLETNKNKSRHKHDNIEPLLWGIIALSWYKKRNGEECLHEVSE